ncbi:MAG: YerC/YecD family TrpR-related protein [Firmicutes bacterium]|nr:YerC/YecD family TrpR-related protein [Bacillota bacterium]MDD4693190.1 YerC/YecD family TrpR-related protein [Bacillota bacterium]
MGALEKIKDEQIELLVSAILTLNDREDCYKFFEDICTIAEIKAMAQRIAVAKMLQKGETYTEISEITGASTATISRVKRSLNYGADGYNIVLGRLKDEGVI